MLASFSPDAMVRMIQDQLRGRLKHRTHEEIHRTFTTRRGVGDGIVADKVFGGELRDDYVLKVRALVRYPHIRGLEYSRTAGEDFGAVRGVCVGSGFLPAVSAEIIFHN